jgi:hypothetical protein
VPPVEVPLSPSLFVFDTHGLRGRVRRPAGMGSLALFMPNPNRGWQRTPMTNGLSMGYAVVMPSDHRSLRTTPISVVLDPTNFGSCLAKFLESSTIWDCAIQSGWFEFLLSIRHF